MDSTSLGLKKRNVKRMAYQLVIKNILYNLSHPSCNEEASKLFQTFLRRYLNFALKTPRYFKCKNSWIY